MGLEISFLIQEVPGLAFQKYHHIIYDNQSPT